MGTAVFIVTKKFQVDHYFDMVRFLIRFGMRLCLNQLVRQSLTLAKEEDQEYYVYRIHSTAENLQQRKLQLLHHNDGCGLLGPLQSTSIITRIAF